MCSAQALRVWGQCSGFGAPTGAQTPSALAPCVLAGRNLTGRLRGQRGAARPSVSLGVLVARSGFRHRHGPVRGPGFRSCSRRSRPTSLATSRAAYLATCLPANAPRLIAWMLLVHSPAHIAPVSRHISPHMSRHMYPRKLLPYVCLSAACACSCTSRPTHLATSRPTCIATCLSASSSRMLACVLLAHAPRSPRRMSLAASRPHASPHASPQASPA